ncbi:MAG: hypothetical protein HUU08_16520 [Candidatus Brocadia sp.]|nr:hypothetical protein [Candidatus Brocadia sp.]
MKNSHNNDVCREVDVACDEGVLCMGEGGRVTFCWGVATATTPQHEGGIGGEVMRYA